MKPADLARHLERRLVQADFVQLLTLFFGVLLFVIATRWSGVDGSVNDSWYGVAPARLVGVALLGLGYGAAFSERPALHRLAAMGTIVLAALLSFPLELAAYAASHPATPLWWGLLLPLVDGAAYFGAGVALGRASAWARLRSILPLTVPGLLVGLIYLDIRAGAGFLNPLTTATTVAPMHLLLMAIGACATLVLLVRSGRAAAVEGAPA